MYDRTFLFLTSVFMYGVQQSNIRAYYRKLYGLITTKENDTMLCFGFASMVALPMVGFFDCKRSVVMHSVAALIFFGCFTVYGRLLASHLQRHKNKFPITEHHIIDRINTSSWIMILITVSFITAINVYGDSGFTGILEWATVLYFVNFFSIASFVNPYYDSVHLPRFR